MFRFILLLGFVHVGFSAETAFTRAIKAVEDGLSQVTAPGSSRQIAINALMRTVSKADKLSPDQSQVLTNVTNMLEDVLSELATNVVTTNSDVIVYTDALDACNVQAQASLDAALATSETDLAAHTTCRTAQGVLHDTMETDCGAVTTFLDALANTCSLPGPVQDNVEEWTTRLTAIQGFFSSKETAYNTVHNACTVATNAHETKATECNTMQSTYETAVCTYLGDYATVCAGRASCWASSQSTATETNFDTLAADRARIARLILYVQCLIGEVIAGNSATAFTTCTQLPLGDAALAIYTGAPVTYPTESACVVPTQTPFNTVYAAEGCGTGCDYLDLGYATSITC
jgi:hypothetical protein